MTIQNEKPFSFYYRDKTKSPKKKEEEKKFKIFANPVPESSRNNLF